MRLRTTSKDVLPLEVYRHLAVVQFDHEVAEWNYEIGEGTRELASEQLATVDESNVESTVLPGRVASTTSASEDPDIEGLEETLPDTVDTAPNEADEPVFPEPPPFPELNFIKVQTK